MRRLSVPLITQALWAGVVALGVVFVSAALVLDFEVDRDEPLVTVLVATRLMPEGTPGNRIVVEEMYAPTTVRLSQVPYGAIADPLYLCGRHAATDILPGEQLTAASFGAEEGQRQTISSGFSRTRFVTTPERAQGLRTGRASPRGGSSRIERCPRRAFTSAEGAA